MEELRPCPFCGNEPDGANYIVVLYGVKNVEQQLLKDILIIHI
jgi:hypothetical protein